jgi:pyrroline-5-carboxylate reductase
VKATVFLGGGRITTALIAGLRRAGYKAPIVVHDRNPGKLRALRREFGVAVEPDLRRALAAARLLMVAVRPGDVAAVLEQTRHVLSRSSAKVEGPSALIACSLAAGIPLAKLRAQLGPPVCWARAMPSPVARSRRGLTALTFDRGFPRAARQLVRRVFAQVGAVLEIPESRFDVFTVTFSPSHGYQALAALAQAAQKLGLDRPAALVAATHALADAILSWREGEESLEGLLEQAATPGGTAAAVLSTLNAAGHSRMIERGLRAGVARARKNAED